MYRNRLLPYLTALFSSGTPSGSDFSQLISGLGSEVDRPHIVCSSTGSFIPDDQLLTSTVPMFIAAGVNSGIGTCCCSLPVPGASQGGGTQEEKVINVMCDYFKNGWMLDVEGTCTGSPLAHAYYVVASMQPVTGGAGIYEVYSIQRCNPSFDKNGVASESCIRVLHLTYNRSTGCVMSTASRLLLTDGTPIIQSNEVRGIKVVYSTPPKVEDGVLYIRLKLSPVETPTVTVTGVSQESVSLSWGVVADATGYEVILQGVGEAVAVSGTSYVFSGLQPNTQYVIGVRAVGDGVHNASSAWVYEVLTTKSSLILQTPAPVVVSTTAATGVTISWAPVPDAESYSYRVGCGCDCGSLVTGVEGTSIVLKGLQVGKSYQCSVKAVGTEASVLDSDWATIGFTTK